MTAPAPLVVIPARMASNRLPGKPLADIHGKPMIVHVLERALESGAGKVAVACAEAEVAAAVEAAGGLAVMTDPDLPSGSDRVHAALKSLDPDGARFDVVINLQGDLPTLEPSILAFLAQAAMERTADIVTLGVQIIEAEQRANPNVVKIAAAFGAEERFARALYFSRAPVPWDGGDASLPLYHHIGIYAFKRAALERFVSLPPSPLEQRERLEQLRALEAGMAIDVGLVDSTPLGVDTPADLERARSLLAPSS